VSIGVRAVAREDFYAEKRLGRFEIGGSSAVSLENSRS
jgi:hypothetical protein